MDHTGVKRPKRHSFARVHNAWVQWVMGFCIELMTQYKYTPAHLSNQVVPTEAYCITIDAGAPLQWVRKSGKTLTLYCGRHGFLKCSQQYGFHDAKCKYLTTWQQPLSLQTVKFCFFFFSIFFSLVFDSYHKQVVKRNKKRSRRSFGGGGRE